MTVFANTQRAFWIARIRNPPKANHMGGVWERQIRTARSILNALLKTHESSNIAVLHMLLIEGEATVTSQPTTTETINDVQIRVPFSPSNLLTMKSKVIMPSPGSFGPADTYCHKRWKRTQHLVNKIWAKWRKEFI